MSVQLTDHTNGTLENGKMNHMSSENRPEERTQYNDYNRLNVLVLDDSDDHQPVKILTIFNHKCIDRLLPIFT